MRGNHRYQYLTDFNPGLPPLADPTAHGGALWLTPRAMKAWRCNAEIRPNYEPQPDKATGRILASATGMALLSCECVFVATVSALLSRLS